MYDMEEETDNDVASIIQQDENINTCSRQRTKPAGGRFCSLITVEPVILLFFIAVSCTVSIQEEYVFYHYKDRYNLSESIQSKCQDNTSSHDYQLRQQVERSTSTFLFHLSLVSGLPAMVVVVVLGSYSDQAGRKVAMFVPCAGALLRAIVFIVVISLNLDIEFLYIGAAIDGLSGSTGTILMSSFSYLSDVTSQESRVVRLALLESCIGLSMALTQLGLGYLIKATGFLWPVVIYAILLVVNFVYIAKCLPETIAKQPNTKLLTVRHFVKAARIYIKDTEPKRRLKLQLILLAFFISAPAIIDRQDIQMLFQQNSPLCWDSVKIGYYQSIQAITTYIGLVAGVTVLTKLFAMSDVNVAIVTCLCGITAHVFTAFVQNDTMMYLVAVVSIFVLTGPLLRSMSSKLVATQELGALFAGMAFMEVLAFPGGESMFTNIYNATMDTYKGAVFLCMATLYGVSLVLLVVYKVADRYRHQTSTMDINS